VAYERFGLDVELDGRLFHDTAGQRDRDLERDLFAMMHGSVTVRLGWGQVLDRPCHTTAQLAALLRRGGWTADPRACGPTCLI
jgi:very-short-patch-repair endonuclease